MWSKLLLLFALLSIERAAVSAPNYASTLTVNHNLAQAEGFQKAGKTGQAQQIYESLLPSLSREPASPQLGRVLNGLSKVGVSKGSYQEALQFAARSAKVYEQTGDTDGQLHALNNKAIAEIQLGTYSAAQGDLEKALSLSRVGGDDEGRVQTLNNLGSAYYFPGSYSEALEQYGQAADVISGNSDAPWSNYWRQITQVNLATLLQKLGRSQQALHVYQKVEATASGLTRSDQAHLYANLGALYRRLGDPHKALDTYLRAKALYARDHDSDGEIAVLKNIGIAYALDLHDFGHATNTFVVALALAQKTHNRREEMQTRLYLAESFLRIGLVIPARKEFVRAYDMSNELGTVEEQWKSLYGLGRIEQSSGGIGAAEAYFRQAVASIERTRSQLPLSAIRTEFFADKREAYDALLGLLLARNDAAQAFEILERSRARGFQDRMNAKTPQSTTNIMTLDEARASLDDKTLLLEYWAGPGRVGLVWCTRKNSGVVLKQITQQDEIGIQGLLEGFPESLDKMDKRQLTSLDFLFPAPLTFPAGIRHLLVVPDGWISYVPFDLIHAQDASHSMLIERCDISYMPSAVLLRRNATSESQVTYPWSRELIAFGDPIMSDHESTNAQNALDYGSARRLLSSEGEVRNIDRMIHGTSELLLGERDQKRYFLDGRANSARVLHVSTHAFADIDNPENSRMLFSASSPGGAPDYVFLRELYNLDLSQVNLATLSACDTEKGRLIRGEGVQAFSRALLSAGARSALTSLWRVDDRPTSEFMRQFYFFALRRGTSKAEALRLAKLKFLHSETNLNQPRVWAAFVLSGDGLVPLPAALSWTDMVLGVLTALAGFVMLMVICRLWQQRRINGKHNA